MKPPAFQFYPDDFVAGTTILTTEEVGAYILLLCHQWSVGHVPDDEALIRRIARITQAFPLGLVLSKFQKVDGVLKNARLEAERAKQVAYREKQAKNGQKGGRPKGLANPSLTQAETQTQSQTEAKKSSPSPSPSFLLSSGQSEEKNPKEPRPSDITSVKLYAQEINLPLSEACAFWDHFESNGWKVGGKTPMKDWKAGLRMWQRNGQKFNKRPMVEKPKNDMSQYF